MLRSLPALRGLAASLLIASVGFNTGAFAVPGLNVGTEPAVVAAASNGINASALEGSVSIQPQPSAPVLVAHHEASIGASQLLTASATSVAGQVSKSLWGNMVLSMAMQQDDQMQQISKKLGRVSGLVFASVGLISALSVAQGIDGIATLQQDPHPYHPSIIGLVGSGLTLVSVASQATMIHRYKKQLVARQEELADEVAHVLAHLKSDGLNDHVQSELSGLIGPLGAEEFLGLWQAAHPH